LTRFLTYRGGWNLSKAEPASQESVILVPFPDLNPVVGRLRMLHDPSAIAGMPPHVTLMYPFLPPPELSDPVLSELSDLLSRVSAFECAFRRVAEFENGIVYLKPDPEEPFTYLTTALAERFSVLPYGGAFSNVVPHLTVGTLRSSADRLAVKRELSPALPVHARAIAVWIMVGGISLDWKLIQEVRLNP
jgi:2'-5' RNA ligase